MDKKVDDFPCPICFKKTWTSSLNPGDRWCPRCLAGFRPTTMNVMKRSLGDEGCGADILSARKVLP